MRAGRFVRGWNRFKPLQLRVFGSIFLHTLVIASLLYVRAVRVAPVRLPGTASGTRMLLTYSPGHASEQSHASLTAPHAPAVRRAIRKPKPEMQAQTPIVATAAPPSANPDTSSGNDALGSGDVNIALLSFFPVPKPDLTQLPHGTRGDVVIDIVIDATGKIVQLSMAKGVGHGVDEAVIATVQHWTFHPATRNGQPVASEQELLFHYERS